MARSHPPVATSALRLYLLGAFRLERNGALVSVPGRKARALLAYLTLYPEQHTRERLAARFWDSASTTDARLSLRVTLNALRKLDPNLILADTDTVQLNHEAQLWSDVRTFTAQHQRTVKAGEPNEELLRPNPQALFALYRGDLLPEFYEDWVLEERERLRQLYLDALLGLVEEYRSRSEYKLAIETAHKVLEMDRANERAHQHLMFCYVASGDRNAAVAQYLECERALREELAVEPARDTVALYQWIRQAPAETGSNAARLTNLPLLPTSFIGRQREMTELKRLLGATRLLTLTGAGGSGKTRLAVQTATEFIDHYADGVWWVELARVQEGALVASTVARALGVIENRDEPLLVSLVRALRDRQMLLVLDNCEHLVSAAAHLIAELLAQCPRLHILATSRTPLGLNDETLFRTPLLELPLQENTTVAEELVRVESVRLFVERARASSSQFELTDASAQGAARIVRRLEGIPLAIELAAARARIMPVQEIERALDHRFRVLGGGMTVRTAHHETLQMLIDWSYDLLKTPDKLVLQRLAAFRGGATLDAVVAVAYGNTSTAPPADVVSLFAEPVPIVAGLLRGLADHSLININRGAEPVRYEMLETIREYADEKLNSGGEAVPIRTRHLDFFVEWVRTAETFLTGPEQKVWFDRLDADAENIRTALAWAGQAGHTEQALDLSSNLWRYWWTRGYLREGRGWLDTALRMPGADAVERLPLYSKAMNAAGILAMFQGDYSESERLLQKVLGYGEEMGDRALIARTFSNLGLVARHQGDMSRAIELQEKSLVILRESGDKMSVARTLNNLATVLRANGERERAFRAIQESLVLRREAGDLVGVALTVGNLADDAFMEGNWERSAELISESLELSRQLADTVHMTTAVVGLGIIRARQGYAALAVRLFGAGAACMERLGLANTQFPNMERYTDAVAHARESLEPQIFDAEWKVGYALDLTGAVELALKPP